MKPIQVDEFCRLKFLSNPTFSPKGSSACFVVSQADRKGNDYRSYLYLYRDKAFRKLTSFGKERSFQYLDEDTILFPGNREKKDPEEIGSSYYRISLAGGEAELAYSFPISVSKVLPLPGGDLIVVGDVIPGFETLFEGDPKVLKAYQKHLKDEKDYEVIEQNPWWMNGGTFTRGVYSSLFRWDHKKKKLTWLLPKDTIVSNVKIDEAKSSVYFYSSPNKPFLSMVGTSSLCRLDLSTGKQKVLLSEGKDLSFNDYELGTDFLLLTASDNRHGLNTDPDFYRVDYKTGKLSLIARYGESLHSSVGADIRYGGGRSGKMVGNTFYFISTIFDSAKLYKLEGSVISPVTAKEGSVDAFDVCGDKILMVALYDMKAQELYDGNEKQLSHFNTAALRDKYVAQPESLNVQRDGYEIHGFVLKPMNFQKKKKYPVIFDIHGGPKTVYGPVFYHEMQYWASKGYFVIFCNPTGSDGRNVFADIRGKYGTVEYEDLMAFCDAALAAYPEMDKKNLFETGGSYGGFMTNWIIGHTDRFRACASQRSIANWFSFYGISDIGVEFGNDQNATSPWDDPEKLWWHSPMKYAQNVKTPTLFIHSFEDYRCPIAEGYQMFTSLIANGVESKLVCFRGENHELSRSGKPEHRLRRLNEITEWFEKHRG